MFFFPFVGAKRLTPSEFLAKMAGKAQTKSPLVTPSKLQLTPSRMSMTPALAPTKLMNTTATAREESPQPVIKRRRVASSSELTIASEFGTVHKPSFDDWPAFIVSYSSKDGSKTDIPKCAGRK